jgi:Fur family ferric uptake transcriptional regulator
MDDVNELATTLRERGLRMTPQRQQVLTAVDALGHATAEQVCAHVQASSPSFSLSTVYRTLDLLEEIGLVTHAHLDHQAPTYHSTHTHEHLHAVCRVCGRVQEVDASHGRALARGLEREAGFVTDVRHLAVHGTCRGCAGKQEAPP